MTITNTVIANSLSGGDCITGGLIIDGGHNIDSDGSCGLDPANGSLPNTDPVLGPLQNNGGSTWTHALLGSSPAIDAGDDGQCPATDQRGAPRPVDGNGDGLAVCDIGSFEAALVLSPTLVTISGPGEGIVGQSYTFTATVGPITTTLPLAYVWQASGQLPITHTAGITDEVSVTWQLPGMQIITVTASNVSGSVSDSHAITISEAPIEGLTATNDSPTALGHATTFTATITNGTNVSYTWALGDGSGGSGAIMTHTYAALGVYTAVVTASNSVSEVTATTPVTVVEEAIAGLTATSDSPTVLGHATTLTATIGSGTHVSYTWALGMGQAAVGRSSPTPTLRSAPTPRWSRPATA